jgi:hypothetical protein
MNAPETKHLEQSIETVKMMLSSAHEQIDCYKRCNDQLRLSVAMMLDSLFLFPEYMFDELSDAAHTKLIQAVKAMTAALEEKP